MKKKLRDKIIYICFKYYVIAFIFIAVYGQQTGLKDVYKDDFYIGTAVNYWQIQGKDTLSLDILKQHFNSITAENVMKWGAIHPALNKYNFTAADSFVALGEKYNLYIVGHVLVWHHQVPRWVFEDDSGNTIDRNTLLQRMKEHIYTVAGRYKGRVHCWDVVNEAVTDNGEIRRNKWCEIIGEDYIQKAFEYTHEADPDAELIYNDFSMLNPAKRERVIRLVRDLKSKGVRIDGIGMQAHWHLNFPESMEELEETIMAYSELGVKVMITEMDINILPNPRRRIGADISLNFELQKKYNPFVEGLPDSMNLKLAKRYADIFTVFYKLKDKVSRVTLWGIHDGQSWLNFWPIRGRMNYPLLFDRQYKAKLALDAVIKIKQSTKYE